MTRRSPRPVTQGPSPARSRRSWGGYFRSRPLLIAILLAAPPVSAAAPAIAQAGESAVAVVTNCRSFIASGAQGVGLLAALDESAHITFACNPSLSGGPGPFIIPVTSTIEITRSVT